MSYNPFTSVRLIPDFIKGHALQWSIDPVFKDTLPYRYTIETSGTPTFDIIEYEIPVGDTFIGYDTTNFKQDLASDLYYRVRLETEEGTYYSRTLIFSHDRYTRRQYVLANEIMRKEVLRMTKFTGSPGWLLKRKVFGKANAKELEVSSISGMALTNNITDHGTAINGGYYNPVGMFFSTEQTNQTRAMSDNGLGVIETYTQALRTIGFPSLDTYDVIVDAETDERWMIKDKQNTTFPATEIVLVQILQVQLIPYTDPVYKIEIPDI